MDRSTSLYGELYRKYKWYLIITVPMSILLSLASMSVIAIINDSVSNGLENIQYPLKLFIAAILLLFLVGMCTEMINAKLVASVSYYIQMKMVRRVLLTPFEQLERIGFPKVIATLTEDMNTAVRYFHVLPVLFVNTAMVMSGLAYMAYLSVSLLAVVLAFIGIGALSIGALIWITKADRVAIREATDHMMNHYQNVVRGAKELALNSPRNVFIWQKIISTAQNVRSRTARVLSTLVVVDQWGQLLLFALLGFIIYIVNDYLMLSREVIIGYILTMLFLLEPIEKIIESFDELINARVAFRKIDSLRLAEVSGWDNAEEPPALEKIDDLRQGLRLDNIEYVYKVESAQGHEASFALGPISTYFNPGEATFIIGGNGSGKSTLFKLIAGLYPAKAGHINFNNKLITDENLEQYRNYFSIVAPDFCLFEDVLDGEGEPCGDLKVSAMLSRLKLTSVVSSHDSKLSKLDLSHGQRKRLALLQAYLEGRPVILLDEWAADQDPEFKKLFYCEIIPALKKQGKILIVISHDEQYYYQCADRLLKIAEGQLTEIKLDKQAYRGEEVYSFLE